MSVYVGIDVHRKALIVCYACHETIHSGQKPATTTQ